MHGVQHSTWFKERLYRELLSGNAEEQLRAASALAYVRGEKQLLAALKADAAGVRETARRALEYCWFTSAGDEAFRLTQAAYQATEREKYQEALAILDRLVTQYPRFAEGWNRRAAVYWRLGQYEKSRADCERALGLNPNHYGAWQGLGVCQIQLGEVNEACRSLRTALKLLPHDEPTREALQRCEALLRQAPAGQPKGLEMI